MKHSSALETAYCATAYHVFLPVGEMVLRVGQNSPSLDGWLWAEKLDCWAVLTAWNPGSQQRSAGENQRAQNTLRHFLTARNYRVFPGENRADAGDWPVEDSFFVPALDMAAALESGRCFGQNAFLWGRVGEPARLVFLARS